MSEDLSIVTQEDEAVVVVDGAPEVSVIFVTDEADGGQQDVVDQVVIEADGDIVVFSDPAAEIEVVTGEAVHEVVTVGEGAPGRPGEPGPSGVPYVMLFTAGPIGGHRVVRVLDGFADYLDPSDASQANAAIGITTGAAGASSQVPVQLYGEIVEPSWNWVVGLPIFAGPNGTLTQSAPTSGFQRVVATPLSTTSAVVHMLNPIVLE